MKRNPYMPTKITRFAEDKVYCVDQSSHVIHLPGRPDQRQARRDGNSYERYQWVKGAALNTHPHLNSYRFSIKRPIW